MSGRQQVARETDGHAVATRAALVTGSRRIGAAVARALGEACLTSRSRVIDLAGKPTRPRGHSQAADRRCVVLRADLV